MEKKCFIILLAFAFLLSLNACKPKESAYRSVYEKAKSAQKEKEQQTDRDKLFASVDQTQQTLSPAVTSSPSPVVTTPVAPSTPVLTPTFQKEKITAIEGSGIKQYSVIIGSFINKTNAESLRDRMRARGFSTFLAKNEKGMYRVVAATFDNKSDAVQLRDRIKEKYDSEFMDAWLLEKIN